MKKALMGAFWCMIIGAILAIPGYYIGQWIVENLNVWQWMIISAVSYGVMSLIQDWYVSRKTKKIFKDFKFPEFEIKNKPSEEFKEIY